MAERVTLVGIQWTNRRSNLADMAVRLRDGTWFSGPLLAARSRRARLHGIRAVPPGWGVLLQTRSVHGFGLRNPLIVVGLDRHGRVCLIRDLAPRKIVTMAAVTWIAELPTGAVPPSLEARLELLAI
jgi:hypothetical protein